MGCIDVPDTRTHTFIYCIYIIYITLHFSFTLNHCETSSANLAASEMPAHYQTWPGAGRQSENRKSSATDMELYNGWCKYAR